MLSNEYDTVWTNVDVTGHRLHTQTHRQHLTHRSVLFSSRYSTAYCNRIYYHIAAMLRDLHWLRVPERIQAVLAFCCRNHKVPSYLADDLHWTDEAESRHRLRSGSCPRLIVPQTRLSTIGDQSFRVTVARAWNSLPTSITALTSCLLYTSPSPRD